MLNKQITMGRLTATPTLQSTTKGKSVCSFTIASDEDIKREDGTRDTDFIDCVAWGPRAEFVCSYFEKGQLIVVEGRPKPRTYKDKNEVTHKVTELRVDSVYFASSKKEAGQRSGTQSDEQTEADGFNFVEGETDDDLPF